jgi:RNA polymerase sigma factor (sigma-70 family)
VSTRIPHPDRADELIAIRCAMGERDAFNELITRWHEPVWRYLRRVSGADDAAADLSQETWLRVLRGIASLRDPARLRPWLFGIARRVAIDRLRRQYVRAEEDATLEDLPAPEIDAGLESDLAALEAGVASLPLREREALALFYLRELNIEDIAVLLGVPAGTVKSRLFRARQMLRQQMQTEGAGS